MPGPWLFLRLNLHRYVKRSGTHQTGLIKFRDYSPALPNLKLEIAIYRKRLISSIVSEILLPDVFDIWGNRGRALLHSAILKNGYAWHDTREYCRGLSVISAEGSEDQWHCNRFQCDRIPEYKWSESKILNNKIS